MKVWVDPQMKCAYRKIEKYWPTKLPMLRERSTASDFVEVQKDIWVPRQYNRQAMARPRSGERFRGEVHLETQITVKDIAVNTVGDDEFELSVPAGTTILNKAAGGATFTLPQASEDLLAELELGARGFSSSGHDRLRLIACLLCGAVFAAILFFHLRYRRDKA